MELLKQVTYRAPPSGETATWTGAPLTGMVLPSGLIATPCGVHPSGIVAVTVPFAVFTMETESPYSSAT